MADNIIHVRRWQEAHTPTEQELRQRLLDEGLHPSRWSNDPGDVYSAHTHAFHKVVYVVSGSITFGFPVEGEPTTLRPGDRLELPAGIKHNAVAGPEGVVCLEAHRP